MKQRRWLRRSLWVLTGLALLALGLEGVIRIRPFPVEDLTEGFPESARIVDRHGQLMREVVNGQGERARWTPLNELSPRVVEATLAAEDERFHQHRGVDWPSVARAAFDALRAGRIVSGASTLTMQLSRQVHPHPRNVWGKLTEMLDALRMERAFSKQQILTHYLNRVSYGAGATGVEAASRRYFGKPSQHLSLAEAALLAGLPQGPSLLNPLRNPEGAKARQQHVLKRMQLTGRITAEEAQRAMLEPLAFVSPTPPSAMHFTDWVASSGLRGEVRTTLDASLQQEVEALVAEHVRALSMHGLSNASVVVLDNSRCEVLAMVGSADYWHPAHGAVNGALARRQPGSTLKPFTYALAFERGLSPASVVADVETRYGEVGKELFIPQNYSRDFSGPVLMGEALGRSLNVPALRVAQVVGLQPLLTRLRALGFASLDKPGSHYGLGLTLGNGEVTLLELSQAYATLARQGRGCIATPVPREETENPVHFSEEVAYLIADALSDENVRMRAFGANNALMLDFPVAVKTGTSTNWRDNWAVGFTERYTVGVWAGDFEGRSLNQLAGANGAGPLFRKVMHRVALRNGQPRPEALVAPPTVTQTLVCATSGARPTERCPTRRMVRLTTEQLPEHDCPHHQALAIDVRNGLLAGEKCPSRYVAHRVFELLPPSYSAWQKEHGQRVAPTGYSPLCPQEGKVPGAVVITWPRKGEVFLVEPGYDLHTQTLELSAEVEPASSEVRWWVDGQEVARAKWPYSARWKLAPGKHRVVAQAGPRRSEPVEIEVR